jgi:hypothetical protein
VRLRVLEDLEYSDVARALGTTPAAARVRVHRGLNALGAQRLAQAWREALLWIDLTTPTTSLRRVGEPAARPDLRSRPTRRPGWPPSASLLQWAAGTGAAADAEQLQLADTAYTGGSRAVTSNHVAPASPEPNTSPVVEPK